MSEAPRRWGLVLSGLPFAAAGLGFLLLGILPTLSEWRAMQHWQPVPAQVNTQVHYRLLLSTQAGDHYTIGDGFVGHSKAQQAAEAISTLGRLPLRKQS